jgi:hypothetical protein
MHGDNADRRQFYIDTFTGYETILELGVGFGELASVFLDCATKHVIGVDIANWANVTELQAIAEQKNMKYTFILANDLEIDPIECDILYIDSNHTEHQTYQELKKYANTTKKYIAMHDINPLFFTTLKGFDRWYEEEGKNDWKEFYKDYDGCGLLVIERKN